MIMRQRYKPTRTRVVVYLVEETLEHLGCLDGERARDTDRLFKNNCNTNQDNSYCDEPEHIVCAPL